MELNSKVIEQLEDGFFLFTSPNCPTCEKLKNMLAEVELDIVVTELNAYEHQAIAQSLGLMGTPCIIDYRDNREFDRIYGAPSLARLTAFLKGE